MVAAIRFGDVPTWVAAVGTVGTLIVSVSLLRREQQDRRSAQASAVAVTIEPITFGGGNWKAVITNASSSPIYACEVTLVGRNGKARGQGSLDSIPPIGTGEIANIPVDPPAVGDERLLVRVGFRDSAGRHWLRDETGRLTESAG